MNSTSNGTVGRLMELLGEGTSIKNLGRDAGRGRPRL